MCTFEKTEEWIKSMSEFLKSDSEISRYIITYKLKGENFALKELNKAVILTTLLSIPWGYNKISWDMVERMIERLVVNAHEPKRCPYCNRIISYPINEVWVD